MDLHYIVEKRHWSCQTSSGVAAERLKINGETMAGVRVPRGETGWLKLSRASEYGHFASGLNDVGWRATVLHAGPAVPPAFISVRFTAGASAAKRVTAAKPGILTPVLLPSLLDLEDPFAVADLEIAASCEHGDTFICMGGRVKRDPLYRLAQGIGVEIGPGPRPQIHNSKTTRVSYIEEKPAEEWLSTYKTNADGAAWDTPSYVIGKAHELPVEDGSLDFVFSSHVFEHLHNPLGHLEHWKQKLKPGGFVLAVVPATDGTKDYVLPPTSLGGLVDEHSEGGFATPFSAFERWARYAQPKAENVAAVAKKLYGQRFSIHVHVYDHIAINAVLRYSVERLDFSGYRLSYIPNSKDFIFALKA